MKKILFKLCTLCLVIVFLATGCGKKEGQINKIKKEEEKELLKQEEILYYYDMYYNEYTDRETLLANIDTYSLEEDYNRVKIIDKSENYVEALTSVLPGNSMEDKPVYTYIFSITKDNTEVYITYSSLDDNIDYMKSVTKEFKKYVAKYDTLKEAFMAYSEDNQLVVEESAFPDGNSSIKTSIVASNEYTVVVYDNKAKVDKVVLENIDLPNGEVKTLAVAKTKEGNRVWSVDLGISEKSINYKDSIFVELGKKYVYFGYGLNLFARDIQTGKHIWSGDMQLGPNFKKVIETDDKIFAINMSTDEEYNIEILNYKGEWIDSVSFFPFFEYDNHYYQIKDLESAKLENGYITIDLYENKKYTNVVGKLKIDIKTYDIKFEKIK